MKSVLYSSFNLITTLLALISFVNAQRRNYDKYYKWRAEDLDAYTESGAQCAAAINALSPQATVDDAWTVNGDCLGLYLDFMRPTSSQVGNATKHSNSSLNTSLDPRRLPRRLGAMDSPPYRQAIWATVCVCSQGNAGTKIYAGP